MNASGGAEGVGRAVNEAVVIAFIGRLRLQLRLHADAARDPSRDLGDQDERLARGPRDWLAELGDIARFGGQRRGPRLHRPRLPVLRRVAAPGRHPDRRLDPDHLGPGLHPRAHLRDRGRLPAARPGRPLLRRRLHRLVRPARDRAVRVRLHALGQGRHRDRRRARLDADLRRDRRARGHGRPAR